MSAHEHFNILRTSLNALLNEGFQLIQRANYRSDAHGLCPLSMARVYMHYYNPPMQFMGGFKDFWDGSNVSVLVTPHDEYELGRVVAASLMRYCQWEDIPIS
jgi:hypothetical protein